MFFIVWTGRMVGLLGPMTDSVPFHCCVGPTNSPVMLLYEFYSINLNRYKKKNAIKDVIIAPLLGRLQLYKS